MSDPPASDALDAAIAATAERLLASRCPQGYWRGKLSASALSTATAVFALHRADPAAHRRSVQRGLEWLCENRNADGGWGDTVRGPSNLPTTLLAWSALSVDEGGRGDVVAGAEAWIAAAAGGLDGPRIAAAVNEIYGGDRTFSAPILATCALAGRLGAGADVWRHVAPLPFEVGVLPHRLLKWLRLPTVSYALPALIAIGQIRHHFLPAMNPLFRALRVWMRGPTLRRLLRIQPESGGFLEAAPLTSFVVMSLSAMGRGTRPAAARGVAFLLRSVRPDGSWPIDTDLATWVTTLAAGALGDRLSRDERGSIRRWLLGQQYRRPHPYTGAAPGGWAWTDLSGGVPDADDTAGALLAVRRLGAIDADARAAGVAGVRWLLDIQNRDGGLPTFCRGWGRLPFDRSSPDLTAHALRAWWAWRGDLPVGLRPRVARSMDRALAYLARDQRPDGAWIPRWFGNQHEPDQENPTYGTARVVIALAELDPGRFPAAAELASRGAAWLRAAQNPDGGWGGGTSSASSIEETALAGEALTAVGQAPANPAWATWLIDHIDQSPPAPIGLYFAKLWYAEELYPPLFALSALQRLRRGRRMEPMECGAGGTALAGARGDNRKPKRRRGRRTP